MKKLITTRQQNSETIDMVKCFLTFTVMLLPFVFFGFYLQSRNLVISQLLFLFAGWLCWTFIEYTNHRFWSHSREKKRRGNLYYVHMNHHQHPTEIKITSLHRTISIIISIGLFTLSIFTQNFITF